MFDYLINVMPQLLSGAGITIKLFALTLLGSIPLGILLAFVLASRLKVLKFIVQVYVWLMRGTPLLLQLIFVFYGLPILNIVFDRFDAALLSIMRLTSQKYSVAASSRSRQVNMKQRKSCG